MTQVILIGGKAKAGKDTAAKYIKEFLEEKEKDVLIVHYGDLLKFICTNYFNWNGVKDTHGRELLQRIGTDIIRKQYPNFWSSFVMFMVDLFKNTWDYVIIPDTRFPDEIEQWKTRSADSIEKVTYIRIDRPGYNNGLNSVQQRHESETALDNYEYDCKIVNSGTLEQYKEKCLSVAINLYIDILNLIKEI